MIDAPPPVFCLGALHWDIIAHAARPLGRGGDEPGRILVRPGGVAFNVARALARQGLAVALVSATGSGPETEALLAEVRAAGIETDRILTLPGLPADRYIAIEDADGLAAAVADSRTLEAAGARILDLLRPAAAPFEDTPGSGEADAPARPTIVVESNLTPDVLGALALHPVLRDADLRLLPAGPGKAARLLPLLSHPAATLYVNRAEAEALCGAPLADAVAAAQALRALGARRAIVTDGASAVADAAGHEVFSLVPPKVRVARVTGAGDTFVAAHLAAERRGARPDAALAAALAAAADHISVPDHGAAAKGEPPW